MDKVILETVSMTEMTSFTNLREYYVYIATKYSPAQRLRGLEPLSEGSGIVEAKLSQSRRALAVCGQHPHRDRIGGLSRLVERSPLTVSFAVIRFYIMSKILEGPCDEFTGGPPKS